MFSFVYRRKRSAIPQAYRTLESRETAAVAGGLSPNQFPPPGSGGLGAAKDPNG